MGDPATHRRPGHMAAQATKQPLNLRMDAAIILRLKRHALDAGTTASDVVAELIVEHLGSTPEADAGGTSINMEVA